MNGYNNNSIVPTIGLQRDKLTLKSELRHLSIKDRHQLSTLLDTNHGWKQLATVIPKPDDGNGLLISSSNITVLEDLIKIGKSPTQALIDFWGTSGRKRATIEDMVKLLNNCHLYRTSLFIVKDVLKIESFEHLIDSNLNNDNYLINSDEKCYDKLMSTLSIANTSAANKCDKLGNDNKCYHINELSMKLCQLSDDNKYNTNSNHLIDPSAPNESQISFSDSYKIQTDFNNVNGLTENLIQYCYNDISNTTNSFSDNFKLGEGAFGGVFRCQFTQSEDPIAVKRLKVDFQKQFLSELKVMTKFSHKNLLSIRGISTDGPSLLIVYDYMSNGSLQDCLQYRPQYINWKQRLSITLGTAEGICHLHTFNSKPYVHRDIKSANILLDDNFNARVGDFGLVRIGGSGTNTSTSPLATTIIGTTIYMAPEAYRGDISVKLDTFSFGIVLLELLTGLKPYDESREGYDLLSYIEEKAIDFEDNDKNFIETIIDKTIGHLNDMIGLQLYEISRKCVEQRKKCRPSMTQVLESLKKIEFI